MKAASSEWYTTTSRHALPLPPSPSSSAASTSRDHLDRVPHRQDLLLGPRYRTSNELPSSPYTGTYDASSSQRTVSTDFESRTYSTGHTTTTTTHSKSSESGRASESFASGSGSRGSYGERRRRTLSKSTTPALDSLTSTSESFYLTANSDKYKERIAPLFYPSTFSYDSRLSSFLPTNLSQRLSTETEYSEGEGAFATTEPDASATEAEESESVCIPEELESEEEEENDESVYRSFKQSLMMLHPRPQLRFKSPSVSPAVSLRSVLTELEEDEEDIPPEQVEDDLHTTTEEDEGEDEGTPDRAGTSSVTSSDSFTRSYFRHVPKSPVKVRVKVEKATPDKDDKKVKVTVHFEDDYDSEEEEDDEDASATTSTADTIRHRFGGTHSSYSGSDDEEDDDGSHSQNTNEQSDSAEDNSLSEEDHESERSIQDKTELHNILTTNPVRRAGQSMGSSSTGTQSTSRVDGPSTSLTSTTSTTATTTQSKDDSDQKDVSGGSSGGGGGTTGKTTTGSSNSSRSHSARSSPVGRCSSRHKMYLVGGKVRSLSARMRAFPPPRHAPIRQDTYTLHEDESSEHTPSITKTGSTSSNSDTDHRPFSKLSRFATFTSGKLGLSELPPLPERCHSASFTRNRQFSAAMAQLSEGDLRTPQGGFSGLPPISLKPSTESSTSSGSLMKPRPLERNLTYTILSHTPSMEEEEEYAPTDLSYLRRLSELEHATKEFSSEVEKKHLLFSKQVPFDSIYSIGNLDQQRFNDLIALSSVNKEHQDSFIFPPLNWTNQSRGDDDPGDSMQLMESIRTRSNNSESSFASSSVQKARKVQFEDDKSEEDVINKDYITYGELMKESVDEPDSTKDRLRRFALAKIRKQIEQERKRLQSIELEGSENDDSDDDEEEEDGDDESSEDEDESVKKRGLGIILQKSIDDGGTHIPMLSTAAATGPMSKTASVRAQSTEEHDFPMVINQTEDGNWGQDMRKTFDGDKSEKEPSPPLATRPASAESGYRAMPPSRVTSRDISREQSVDKDEIEKEKDRILEEWRKGGEVGPAPTTVTASIAGSSSSHRPFAHIINSESGSVFTLADVGGQEREGHDSLIKGDIDLTKELPGEERRIAQIWDEFNRDERSGGGMADYEFSTLLDEMIMDVNSYKPQLSIGLNSNSSQSLQVANQGITASPYEPPNFENRKYQTLSEMISLLSHNLRLVSSETLEDHMASLISLVSSVLKKVRKNKVEDDYLTQIACLSAIRVLCDRIQEMQSSQNLKYADLSWLFRILCKYSSDTESKIKPEASFCLARLVKVAGPQLVVRPIYFILVMESEGAGKSTTGAKTKSAAIDTLTYALLTFSRDEFHNLEEIAGWVCLSMLNEERRIRQSSLECLAVIAKHLGGREKALPLFHTLFLKEELDHFSRSPSPESVKTTKTGKSGKSGKSNHIPLSVHGTVRLLTGPGFPIAQPIDAITARLEKDVLPVPSTKGLIEYAVNVPTGKDLVLLMTHMLDKDDDEWDFSSSTDSLDSSKSKSSKRSSVGSIGFSDIDWTGEGSNKEKKGDDEELISPDVAYILLGKGRVNKQEVVLLDTYKKEIIPEIIEMLNRKQEGKGRNKKRWAKLNKKRRKRKRKGRADGGDGGPLIPTLSFDCDDGEGNQDVSNSGEMPVPSVDLPDDEVFEGGPTVVIDPPQADEMSLHTETPSSTTKT